MNCITHEWQLGPIILFVCTIITYHLQMAFFIVHKNQVDCRYKPQVSNYCLYLITAVLILLTNRIWIIKKLCLIRCFVEILFLVWLSAHVLWWPTFNVPLTEWSVLLCIATWTDKNTVIRIQQWLPLISNNMILKNEVLENKILENEITE